MRRAVGARHTEFGGGEGYPGRKPDGQAQVLDSDEAARAVHAAAWDEVRGDPGVGAGVAERYIALGQPVPQRPVPLDETESANGYIYDAQNGTFTRAVG